jgi:hypothetical protein
VESLLARVGTLTAGMLVTSTDLDYEFSSSIGTLSFAQHQSVEEDFVAV